MKNFETEKQLIIVELDEEIRKFPNDKLLSRLKEIIVKTISPIDLDKTLSRIVIDSLQNEDIGSKIIQFESYFMDYTNLIESNELKKLAKSLKKNNIKITFYGKAWSKIDANWIYFDTFLELERIKNEYNFSENIVIHSNLDKKSGTESGFIDKVTGEGLMGKLKNN